MERDVDGLIRVLREHPSDGLDQALSSIDHVGSDADRSRLLRAMGEAARHAATMADSVEYLRQAEAAADTCGREDLAAWAAYTLSGSLYLAGQRPEAEIALQRAAARGGDELRGPIAFQRGNMAAQDGDSAAATRHYDVAEPLLRSSDERYLLAILAGNRGQLSLSAGELADAHDHFQNALGLLEAEGAMLRAVAMRHNLGRVEQARGNYVSALEQFDVAGREAQRLGRRFSHLGIDQLELLAGLGLFREAVDTGGPLIDLLREDVGEASAAAHAGLVVGMCHRELGETAAAIERLAAATSAFEQQCRHAWADRVRLALIETAADAEIDMEELHGLAHRFEQLGWHADHRRVLVRILRSDPTDEAAVRRLADLLLEETGLPVVEIIPVLEALSRHDAACGRSVQAAARLDQAVDAVVEAQAAVAATDLRHGLSAHLRQIRLLGYDVHQHDPAELFDWVERSRRLSTVAQPSLRQPSDEMRVAMRELRSLRRRQRDTDQPTTEDREAERRLELELVRLDRLRPNRRADGPTSSAEMPDSAVVLQYRVSHGALHCITRHGNDHRDVRLATSDEVDRLATSLRAALSARNLGLPAPVDELVDQIADLVLPSIPDAELVVVLPDAPVLGVPWMSLPPLRRRSVSVSPSLEAAARPVAIPSRSRRTSIVVGPGVLHADDEVRQLLSAQPNADVIVGADATVARTLQAWEEADVLHLICHGSHRRSDPRFSELHMTDGPLTSLDIEGVERSPQIVVFSACEIGIVEPTLGGELSGLAAVALASGAQSIVASTTPLADTSATADMMGRLHGHLAAGSRPATALSMAIEEASASDGADLFGSLVCLGAG